jgi:tetrahydromethanopterin S-methyltransferase subunit E
LTQIRSGKKRKNFCVKFGELFAGWIFGLFCLLEEGCGEDWKMVLEGEFLWWGKFTVRILEFFVRKVYGKDPGIFFGEML